MKYTCNYTDVWRSELSLITRCFVSCFNKRKVLLNYDVIIDVLFRCFLKQTLLWKGTVQAFHASKEYKKW